MRERTFVLKVTVRFSLRAVNSIRRIRGEPSDIKTTLLPALAWAEDESLVCLRAIKSSVLFTYNHRMRKRKML